MQMAKSGWWFDEFQHVGVDFDDVEQVEMYSQKQGRTAEDERNLIERLGISQGDLIMEFGCGTGIFAIEAAKQCRHVYAIDISQAMLDYVARSAIREGIQNLTLTHAGFLSYEHVGKPVDYIVTKYAFHHLPDFWKSVALDRMANMLKPRGVLYLEDVIYSFESTPYRDAIPQWIDRVVKPDQPSFSRGDFEMHVREEYSTFDWIIEGLLDRNGFDVKETEAWSDTYANYVAVKR